MQWHKYRTHDPALVWLRGLLHEAVAQMDAQQQAAAPAGGGPQVAEPTHRSLQSLRETVNQSTNRATSTVHRCQLAMCATGARA